MAIASSGRRPVVSIMERNGMIDEINILKYFLQRAYTFIIPESKTLSDFKEWVDTVIALKPYLEEALTSFIVFDKDK